MFLPAINTGLHGYRYPHLWKKRRKIVNLFPDNSSPYAKNSKKAIDGARLRAEPYLGTVSGLLPLQYWVNDQQGGTEVGARAHGNVA